MFDPKTIRTFRFVACDFDESTGRACFTYAFDGEAKDVVSFQEVFQFPLPQDGTVRNIKAVRHAVFLLSLLAGVSYYKAAVPGELRIESGSLTQTEREYITQMYFDGLGEFAYCNRVHLRDHMQVIADECDTREPIVADIQERALVAVGGGKDSCVSIAALQHSAIPMALASVNTARPIMDVIAACQLPALHIKRTISPELFRINREGALNGHVPVTAIVSTALYITALLHGYNAVVMSNERSASVGNIEWDGRIVNHQWSKSFEAEQLLAKALVQTCASNVAYFSLLRPLSELDIAKRFAKLTMFHDVFTSCNRAFRIDAARRSDRWCGDCPKCRFVYLALAPYLSPRRLDEIFGSDMLDDASQASGFDALIGWQAHKPFECVGEIEESLAAFLLLRQSDQWKSHALVRRFTEEIYPSLALERTYEAKLLSDPFDASPAHAVPRRYLDALYALT